MFSLNNKMDKLVEVMETKFKYFCYELSAWDSYVQRLQLPNDCDIQSLLEEIYSGKSLFSVVPRFSKRDLSKFNLRSAFFATRDVLVKEGKFYFSEERDYEQAGKLLISPKNIIGRENLERIIAQGESQYIKDYKKMLKRTPKIGSFYGD